MSALVAVTDGRRACFGCDSGSFGSDDSVAIVNNQKIFKRSGWVIGGAGWWRLNTLLYHELELEPVKRRDLDRFVGIELMGRIEDLLRRHRCSNTEDVWSLLIYHKGNLYAADHSYMVEHLTDGFGAAGSVHLASLGVFHYLKSFKLSLRERAEAALDAAYCVGTAAAGAKKFIST